MNFKIERNEKSDPFRETQITEMKIRHGKFRLTFWVEGKAPKKMRRAICLAIYRQIKPLLRLQHAAIVHQESSGDTRFREVRRMTGFSQATGLKSRAQQLGTAIRLARLKKEWTLKDLSRETGISFSHLSRIEHGSSALRASTLLKIEAALQVRFQDAPSEFNSETKKELAS